MTPLDPDATTTPDTTIRAALLEDVDRLAALVAQLGYPSPPAEVLARLRTLGSSDDRELLVAVTGGEVVGYAELRVEDGLASDGAAQLQGLVVDERFRGRGIGARLVAASEAWTRARGLTVLRLRSNVTRRDAHRFYERLGFATTKTSLVFAKEVQRPSSPGAPTARTS